MIAGRSRSRSRVPPQARPRGGGGRRAAARLAALSWVAALVVASPSFAETGRGEIAAFIDSYVEQLAARQDAGAATDTGPPPLAVAGWDGGDPVITRFLRDGLLRALRRRDVAAITVEPAERSRLSPESTFEDRATLLASLESADGLVVVRVEEGAGDVRAALRWMTLNEESPIGPSAELSLGRVDERGAIRSQVRYTRTTVSVRGTFARNDLLGPIRVSSGDLDGVVDYSWQVLHGAVAVDVAITARFVASFTYRLGLGEVLFVRTGGSGAQVVEDIELVSVSRPLTGGERWLNGSSFELGGGYRLELGQSMSLLLRGGIPFRYGYGRVLTDGVETDSFGTFLVGFGAGAELQAALSPTLQLGLNLAGYQLLPTTVSLADGDLQLWPSYAIAELGIGINL